MSACAHFSMHHNQNQLALTSLSSRVCASTITDRCRSRSCENHCESSSRMQCSFQPQIHFCTPCLSRTKPHNRTTTPPYLRSPYISAASALALADNAAHLALRCCCKAASLSTRLPLLRVTNRLNIESNPKPCPKRIVIFVCTTNSFCEITLHNCIATAHTRP